MQAEGRSVASQSAHTPAHRDRAMEVRKKKDLSLSFQWSVARIYMVTVTSVHHILRLFVNYLNSNLRICVHRDPDYPCLLPLGNPPP